MKNLFSTLKIKTNLLILIGFFIISLVLIMVSALSGLKHELYQDRKLKIQEQTESAHSLVEHFYKLSTSGKITADQAKAQATQALAAIRYGENNYFWINDKSPKMLMHPIKPELHGKDLSNTKDLNGKKLFMEMLSVVKQQSEGIVDYYWSKPGSDVSVPKLSYVKGFNQWNWIIGTGIYIDDIEEIFWEEAIKEISIGLVALFVIIILASLISASIINPVNRVRDAMQHIKDTHDLTSTIDCSAKNEIGDMAESLNEMITSFRQSLDEVNQAAKQTFDTATQLGTVSVQTRSGVASTKEQTEQLATAMNEMSMTVQEVATNASSAATSAKQADEKTSFGKDVVLQTVESINSLAAGVNSGTQAILSLDNEVANISNVVDVINSIAEQTNLLALNAAIEAARAGEQGRGFAVVADEVRTLAQRTQESTEEIVESIQSLQNVADNAVKIMENSQSQANQSVEKGTSAGAALQEIADVVANISDMNTQIATAAEEQSMVANEINQNVTTIANIANDTFDGANQTASSSEQLNALAYALQKKVSEYKI